MTGLDVLLGDERATLPERPLKNGGQAAVHAVSDRLVVKIYHEPPHAAQERRLTAMLRMAPLGGRPTHAVQPPELAWPTALARTPDGRFLGYAMPRFSEPGHVPLTALFTRAGRLRMFPEQADWRFMLGVAWNLAFMTARMHRERLVIGDFSSNNLVVDRDGFITVLDCDSIDFTDPATGEHFACQMRTADYCAPELLKGGPTTAASDDFALAVLVYQLLTGGNHPFGGVPHDSDPDSTVRDNIAAGRSYVVRPDQVTVPRGVIDPAVLPPALLELTRTAFGPGTADPAARPQARDWFLALDQERSRIQRCTIRPRHTYGSHLTACPWCIRAAITNHDPFNPPAPVLPPAPPPAKHRTAALILAVIVLLALLAVAFIVGSH